MLLLRHLRSNLLAMFSLYLPQPCLLGTGTRICMIGGLLCLFSSSAISATWVVVYPQSVIKDDARQAYPRALLDLALQKTGVRYEMSASLKELSQAKSLRKLKENIDVKVVWSMTDVQRENDLLPIRIPIGKGLIGWRVFMTHKDKPFYKKDINSLEDLLVYAPVQATDWPDTKILQANGFNVVMSQNYVEAANLLARKQADFFPRSVIEALDEMQSTQIDADIRLRKDIAIYYPSAMYFFVNKRNVTLANLIQTGLERAIADGSFDVLFHQYHDDMLAQLNFSHIKYWKLENPLLPPLTPLDKPEYWFTPN